MCSPISRPGKLETPSGVPFFGVIRDGPFLSRKRSDLGCAALDHWFHIRADSGRRTSTDFKETPFGLRIHSLTTDRLLRSAILERAALLAVLWHGDCAAESKSSIGSYLVTFCVGCTVGYGFRTLVFLPTYR